MKIGLIDVDAWSRGKGIYKVTYPNLALMKISAYHKAQGDSVEWYDSPMTSGHMDIVYMSRVFGDGYTKDYDLPVDADRIIKGGSGYAIHVENEIECYNKDQDPSLPDEIEHIMPDYSIYEQFGIRSTAYGFLTRGCPRGCNFCHVKTMQGTRVRTVARLSEFWEGQKNISLLDPNITASPDYFLHMADLEKSGAVVDFSQGLDIRCLTPEKIEALNRVNWKWIHFAWDNPKDDLEDKFRLLHKHLKKCDKHHVMVYCLTNFNSTHAEDMHRVQVLRDLHIQPYIMVYRKETAPAVTRRLQRWVNWPRFFWKVPDFAEWQRNEYREVILDENNGHESG